MSSVKTPRSKKTKKTLAILFAIVIFAVFFVFAFAQWAKRISNPLSESAVLNAPIVNVSAGVPGKIKTMHIQDRSEERRVGKGGSTRIVGTCSGVNNRDTADGVGYFRLRRRTGYSAA